MGERKRFRVRYPNPDDAPRDLTEGARHVFPPDRVIEEWALTGRVRPDLVWPTEPRPGIIVRVVHPHPAAGRPFLDVMAEDVPPMQVYVGTILTALGPKVLCPHGTLALLVNHLAHRPIASDADRAAVVNACEPWLRDRFPMLARAADNVPDYEDPADYEKWLAGVEAVYGRYVSVPAPPFALTAVNRMPETTPNLLVRPDALDQLKGHGRAN